MRHAILGNGNLGNAIAKKLVARNIDFHVFSTMSGWKYPASGIQEICDYCPDHVWCTVGAGSVEQAVANYAPFADLHVRLPMELVQGLNDRVSLHFFSTDYCCVQPQSLYALSKLNMEQLVIMAHRPKTYVYRVGSLYGNHKLRNTFPYKLKVNAAAGKQISLPTNCISPTPVDWLADILINMSDCDTYGDRSSTPLLIHPKGCCTVKEWGELILQKNVGTREPDTSRPLDCTHLDLNEAPTWKELWLERKHWFINYPALKAEL